MFAPDYDVPSDVSPFVPLPVLDLCPHCSTAIPLLGAMVVYTDRVAHRPLCSECARKVAA